jgi:hypothetical protein
VRRPEPVEIEFGLVLALAVLALGAVLLGLV